MRKGIAPPAVACALAMTAASVVPAGASAPAFNPGPSGATISVVSVNGSGCPTGTAAVAVSPSRDAFTVTYSDYVAQVGGGSKPADYRKNCRIILRVHPPRGFTYAVSSADHRTYVSLQAGAEAILRSSYYFLGASDVKEFIHRRLGPYEGTWQVTDEVQEPQLPWSPCGGEQNLNVTTELQVNGGASDPSKVNFIAAGVFDGGGMPTYHFAWKTCP
ncbi:DUF4360 domain-containing protein [Actinomadura roseirufa]|uniref:DUF4360 domain-containing protein n=1 Tax=Actinomadura roseirufa TaxID=2094049 RepID=UPI0010413476|nr:DUF4360 domain-containing protein [Actinomadura roseirufa]